MSSPAAELPRASSHRPRGTPRPSSRTRWRALVLVLVHVAIAIHIAQWQLSGVTVTPIEPSEAGETLTLGYVNAGFVALLLMVLSTLIFGRFFCGWACHVVALQDASSALLAKLRVKPAPIRSRFLAWVPLFAALEMFFLPSLLRWWEGGESPEMRAAFLTSDFWGRFPGLGIALATFVVDGFLLVWFFGSKGFCTYACPYGAIFGVADRVAPGRIRVTDACEGCGHCTATCTSNVQVQAEVAKFGAVVDPGCMKCMDCVSVCPKDALYFGFRPSVERKPARRRPSRTYDFTLGEEVLLAAVFAGAFYAFRNLYGRVPFLLALGLSVIAALATLFLVRAVRRRDFTLQHTVVRSGGRWKPKGVALALALALFVAFTVHSGVVQAWSRGGVERLEAATRLPPGSERTETLTAARERLERAERWSLVDDPGQLNPLGQILAAEGEFERARELARRSLSVEEEQRAPRLSLIDVALLEGDLDAAVGELEALFEHHPGDEAGGERLREVLRRDLQRLDAHVLQVRWFLARDLADDARGALDWLVERFPDEPAPRELLDEVERR